ncbi:MAG: VCBS repeat-containing protein [Planctomycetota bacterium]
MRRKLFPVALAAALLPTTLPAQHYEPEYDLPWLGYEVNVYPKGFAIWDATSADFDGDGIVDIAAVSWYPNPELSVLFGDGRGGFLVPLRFPILLGSLGVEAADVDNDGDLDVLLSDTGQFWQGNTFSVFRNDGARTFTFTGNYLCGNGPSGIATGDFDGDGNVDVAVAHDDYIVPGRSIAVVFGTGLGTFGPPNVIAMPSGTYDIEVADLDRDGRQDLVVGHEGRRVSLLFNLGNGAFSTPTALTPEPLGSLFRTPDVMLGDPDRDGDVDIFFSGEGSVNTGVGFVDLFRNQGNGTFGAPQRITLAPEMDGAGGMLLRDVDGNGTPDLLAASGYGWWALLPGDGAGGFGAARGYAAGAGPFRFVCGDFDQDVDVDVAVIARDSMEACTYLNDGHAGFVQPTLSPMVDPSLAPISSSQVQGADLDRDGNTDFVVGYSANFVTRTGISVRMGRSDGSLGPIVDYPTPLFPQVIAVGDLDGDAYPDLVWVETSFGLGSPSLRLKLNDGTGAFGTTQTLSQQARGGDDGALALLDVDGDGDLDIVVTAPLFDLLVLKNLGGGRFSLPTTHTVSSVASAIAGGDFDRDGDVDLATNTGVQGYFEVSLNQGTGTFGPPVTETSGRGVAAIAVADVDLDGILDLCGGYDLDGDGATVLRGRGDGSFRPARSYYGTYSGSTDNLRVVDVDVDGWLDLMVANPTSQDVSYWRNAGNGTFERLRRYGVGRPARALVVTDLDHDGVDDLVVHVEANSPTNGWYYPALSVFPGKARGFRDLGFPLAGALGAPTLRGAGLLVPGQTFALVVHNAAVNAPCVLGLGAGRLDIPFFGGQLVPRPDLAFPLVTDSSGTASLPLRWPGAMAIGTSLVSQAWILDATAPFGLAASNGLSITRL